MRLLPAASALVILVAGARHDRARRPESELTMFGLDDWIASFSDGTTLALVCRRRRRARPPPRDRSRPPRGRLDADRRRLASARPRAAARLGLSWGARPRDDPVRLRPADRALPDATCPSPRSEAAETTVGLVIVGARGLAAPALAPRRLPHAPARPRRARSHAARRTATRPRRTSTRGSADAARRLRDRARARDGRQRRRRRAAAGLDPRPGDRGRRAGVFAACTALSMAALSTGLGFTLGRRSLFPALAPVLGVVSLVLRRLVCAGSPSGRPLLFLDGGRSPRRSWRPTPLDALDDDEERDVRGAPRRLRALPRGARGLAGGRRGARLRRRRPGPAAGAEASGSSPGARPSARTSSRCRARRRRWRRRSRPRPRSPPPSRSASASGRRPARPRATRSRRARQARREARRRWAIAARVAVAPDGAAAIAPAVPPAPERQDVRGLGDPRRQRPRRAGLFLGGATCTTDRRLARHVPRGSVVAVTLERAGGVEPADAASRLAATRGGVVTALPDGTAAARHAPSRDLAQLSDEALLVAGRALRRGRAGRALRPLRPRRLRPRPADPARRGARPGRRAGGVPRASGATPTASSPSARRRAPGS